MLVTGTNDSVSEVVDMIATRLIYEQSMHTLKLAITNSSTLTMVAPSAFE